MVRLLVGCVAICCSLNCMAALQPQSLAQLCTVLSDTRLRGGEWARYENGEEGCKSGQRSIKPDAVDNNKISFRAKGVDGVAHRVELTLQVVLPSDEYAAKRELIRATKRLAVRVLGLSIPHAFDEAIINAVPIHLEVGGGQATLTRTMLNKQGYVLSVMME
jgi:hypothetical protein